MALLLLIDTSGNPGTVALALDGQLLSLRQNGSERDHAATLNGMVAAVLAEGGRSLQDVQGLGVCNGPGSYTGLRIGLATAKGFCYALRLPLYLQHRLALLAGQQRASHPEAAVFLALLWARQGEFFAAAYDRSGEALLAPQHLFEDGLLHFLEGLRNRPLVVTTDAPEALDNQQLMRLESVYPATIDPGYWAREANRQHTQKDAASLHLAEPFYLKTAYTTIKIK